MSFERWGYEFDGAFIDPGDLKSIPGVYVILCVTMKDFFVLDVGQAEDVEDRCQNHDRFNCWENNCNYYGIIYFSAHYMPGSSEKSRRLVETLIRVKTNPPCGER